MESSSEYSSDEEAVGNDDASGVETDSENERGDFKATDKHHGSTRKDLGNIAFEDLENMKSEIGMKRYTELLAAMDNRTMAEAEASKTKEKKKQSEFKKTKRTKSSPLELSSKIKVSKVRKVVPTKKKVTRDPRFDDLSGTYNEEMFEKSYSFIEEMRQTEKKELIARLQKEKDAFKKDAMAKLIQRLDQQESNKKRRNEQKIKERRRKKEEIAMVRDGKRPFYLKKSDKKKLELMERFKTLKKSGKLDKYMSKKRKRNAAKERKKLPASSS